MAITEAQRHHLFRRPEEVLGHEEATTLMEHLPPVGWADVSTKGDLTQQLALTRADLERQITATRTDLTQQLALTRADLEQQLALTRSDLEQQITATRTDLTQQITATRTDLELAMEHGFREQTRTMVLANLATMVALASGLIAAVRV